MRISIALMTGIIALTGISLGCLLNASSPWASVATAAYFVTLAMGPLGIVYRTGRTRAFYVGLAAWAWCFQMADYSDPEIAPRSPTTRILAWAYPLLIPERRQTKAELYGFVPLDLKSIVSDQPFNNLGEAVDIFIDDKIIIEGASLTRAPMAPPPGSSVPGFQISLILYPEQVTVLEQAKTEGKRIRLVPHKPGLLPRIMGTTTVDRKSFHEVGHSLFGLLLGLTGGLIGIRFHRTREG